MNPNYIKFEQHGFFEEVWDVKTGKVLGTRPAEHSDPSRRFGVYGKKEEVATKPFILQCGHKTREFKASIKHPRKLSTQIFPVCGKMIRE